MSTCSDAAPVHQPLSRRQFLAAVSSASLPLLHSGAHALEARPPRFLLEWGRKGAGEGEFSACVGIAIGPNDELYTAEFRNQRVQRFTPGGAFLGTFPVQQHAGGLAVDRDSTVYVAHWNSHKIAAYSRSGALLREWGKVGTADGEFRSAWGSLGGEEGQFNSPVGVGLDADRTVFVSDEGNHMQKFTCAAVLP